MSLEVIFMLLFLIKTNLILIFAKFSTNVVLKNAKCIYDRPQLLKFNVVKQLFGLIIFDKVDNVLNLLFRD